MGFTRNDAFPSKWLKADDLSGGPQTLIIAGVTPDTLTNDDGEKTVYILRFQDHDKGLVLNQTNWLSIEAMYGADTDGWLGNPIKLYKTKVKFGSGVVDAVRILPPDNPAPAKPAAPAGKLADWQMGFVNGVKALFPGKPEKEIAAAIAAAITANGLKGNWRQLTQDQLDTVFQVISQPDDPLAEAGF